MVWLGVVLLMASPGWAGLAGGGADAGMSRAVSGSLPYHLYPHWSFDVGTKMAAPVAGNGMIYFGTELGTMYALDAVSGELRWTFQAVGRIRQPATVTLGSVYFAAGDLTSGRLYALNPWDGRLRWSHEFTGSMVAAPLVQHPLVYFGFNSQTGNVVALSVFDGAEEWWVQAEQYLSGQPAVRDHILMFGTTLTADNESHLYCVDSTTGALLWQQILSGYCSGISLLDQQQAVVTTGGAGTGRIYGLDVSDGGSPLWPPFRVRPFNFWSPPAVHGGVVYSLNKGVVYAVNLLTGEQIWTRLLPVHNEDGPMPFSHAPLSSADHLYITYAYADPAMSSQFYVLDRESGGLMAIYETGTTLIASPIVSGRNLYLTGQGGRLEAKRGLKVTVNGLAMPPSSSGAHIQEGTSYVALRPLLEAAGYLVEWEADTRTVHAEKHDVVLSIQIDSQQASLSSGEMMHLSLHLTHDRLMVAVRTLVEFVGGTISWHADSLSISCDLP